jgi:hypothetical protein
LAWMGPPKKRPSCGSASAAATKSSVTPSTTRWPPSLTYRLLCARRSRLEPRRRRIPPARRQCLPAAHAHALSAVEPFGAAGRRRVRRGHDHGRQRRPVVAQRPGIAVRTQIEIPLYDRTLARRPSSRSTPGRSRSRRRRADAHPVGGAGQHDGRRNGADERAW